MVEARLGTEAAHSYREYMALGPGGIPYNVLGWMVLQLIATRGALSPSPSRMPRRRCARDGVRRSFR